MFLMFWVPHPAQPVPILVIQGVFLALGLLVIKRQKYTDAFLRGEGNSAGSYALVCPGVALTVMLHFWINKGLVGAGMIDKFGLAYWSLISVALAVQIAMILLVLHLNRRLFGRQVDGRAVPA